MSVESTTIELQTKGHADVQDITSQVGQVISQSSMSNGIAIIFCPSSTSALTTIEYESGCVSDLKRLFDEIISPNELQTI